MTLLRSQNGQGLLEAVFAVGILVIAVTAILGLTIINVVGQSESEYQIVANNLAREGIEVVRGLRDSNWLAGRAWDDGLVGPAVPSFDLGSSTWSLDSSAPVTLVYKFGGVYLHGNPGGATQTIYRRQLNLRDVCWDAAGDGSETVAAIGSSCSADEQKVGVKVEALVSWIERRGERSIILEDILYAWK